MAEPLALPAELYEDELDAVDAASRWIEALCTRLVEVEDRALLSLTNGANNLVLWRRGCVFAAALTLRDELNRTQLIRWQAGEVADG